MAAYIGTATMPQTPPPLPQAPPGQVPPAVRPKRNRSAVLIAIVSAAILCLLAILGVRFLSIVRMTIKAVQNRPAGREHVVEAPIYETLLGEGLVGSGFHFKAGDAVYLCTTLHQSDGKMPLEVGSIEFESPIKVVDVVHKQHDIQVLSFMSDELMRIAPLPYSKDAPVDVGLPIYIYADDGVVKGHVSSINRVSGTIKIRTTEAFAAGGQSGGPIVSGETGTVVAVLLGANSPEHATRIEAELLQIPDSLVTSTGHPADVKPPETPPSPP